MKRINTVRLTALFCVIEILAAPAAFSQESFSGKSAYNYCKKLAGEQYAGRNSGLKEVEKAAEWIGARFKDFGLKPAGDNGTYLQEFPLLTTLEEAPAVPELINGFHGKQTYICGDDFYLLTNSGSGR